jgi:type VI secretion system protein ImpE
MDALEHVRSGQVSAALDALQEQVRAEPSEARHRVLQFQLLSVLGQWDRALTQLNVAGEMDAGNLGMVQVYREALASEALRAEVFAGNRTPLIFGDPEQWIALLLEALKLNAAGKFEKGEELRAEALEAVPTTSGSLNGKEFEWIADADTRIGPMLEAIINGRYFWVPFNRIAEMRVEEPEDLRDLVWLPAEFKWVNGGEVVALIPARYPGSELSDDPQIQLGRRTDWEGQGEDLFTGLGQRILVTDQDELSLLEIRNMTLTQSDGGDESRSNG